MEENKSIIEGFEKTVCPRCRSCKYEIVTNGKDYLYGVEGNFNAVECELCKLWYLNPKPKSDFIKCV